MTIKRKLLIAGALLGVSLCASWAPEAEAVAYCDSGYCVGKPASTRCGCPPHTSRSGQSSTCGSWNGTTPSSCWYVP